MEKLFVNRLKDLSAQAERSGRYTYSAFLNYDEQNELRQTERELTAVKLFGGAKGCERVIARFGSAEDIGYDENFPIVLLKAEPLMQKFADYLTHRDILGALMSLGIDRSTTGDIILKDNIAYIFCLNRTADFICDNLTKIKHTDIKCSIAEKLPDCELYHTENVLINTASERLDCLISSLYKISRNKTNLLFSGEKVFINGKQCLNNSVIPKEGDIISVRGYGRFIFNGKERTTKKGREYISVSEYK